MMKNKIICLIVSMLMIVTLFPVVGLAIHTGETNPLHQPPGPAYAPTPSPHIITPAPLIQEHPKITTATMDDVVINIIEQVNESVFLGYEENLTANGPRPTESPACITAAEYIYTQFQSMGLAVRYHHWSNSGITSDNVEATMNGTDESSDEIYIICAHYDTVAAGPGADDDTSGTAAVLIAAQIMSHYQFNHTIKFVCFSGEEQGLLGSEIYASDAATQGWNIAGVLNCDMISYAVSTNDGNNLIVFEDTASDWLYTYTAAINFAYQDYIQLTLEYGGETWGSDHWFFWQNGYSALFYFEFTETPYYHTAEDTIAHINATYAVKNMRLIFATLAALAIGEPLSNPPATPILSGPGTGLTHVLYSFNAVTTDPDGDQIYYRFYWDDGSDSGWLGPVPSGTPANSSHTWDNPGSYDVTVKAKDQNGVESALSPAHTILINPTISIETITGGLFKVKVILKNNGASTVTNIPWWINLSGGILLLGKTTKGTIPTLASGDTITISSGLIIGLGNTLITVTADTTTTSQNAAILLFYIKTM